MIDDRVCPDCDEAWHCGSCACCLVERADDGQPTLYGTGELETSPVSDPHQALREAKLRWTRGAFEVVRDPMGRVA